MTRTKAHVVLLLAAQVAAAACSRSHDGPDAAEPCCDAGPRDAGADTGREPDTGPPDAPPPCVSAEESCNGADDDCDGEVDETPSELACLVPNASAACAVGACAIAECHFGFADCDGDAANGCETDIESDATACGACEWACAEGVACHDGVCDDERIVQVAAGCRHACAVRRSGQLLCWGHNPNGQLGTGDEAARLVPTAVVGDARYVLVATASTFTCAIRAAGTLDCWGGNARGQLGDGSRLSRSTPAPVAGLDHVVALALGPGGNEHALALGHDGALWGWGNNYYGQLGPTGLGEEAVTNPLPIPAGMSVSIATAWGLHMCRFNGGRGRVLGVLEPSRAIRS